MCRREVAGDRGKMMVYVREASREVASYWVFFFFQAEDGIRDYKVTGVQTCALPICAAGILRRVEGDALHEIDVEVAVIVVVKQGYARAHYFRHKEFAGGAGEVAEQIGRASCRGRV